MTRFAIGLLLGLLLGIGGTAAFLITAGGGDYLVGASPRVRELETSLKTADQERDWLRKRLSEADEVMARLESRFSALSARFETLVDNGGAKAPPAPAGATPDTAAPSAAPPPAPAADSAAPSAPSD